LPFRFPTGQFYSLTRLANNLSTPGADGRDAAGIYYNTKTINMKSILLSRGLFALLLLLLSIIADAQRPVNNNRRRPATQTVSTPEPTVNNSAPRSLRDMYPGVPIRVDSSSLSADAGKKGQRPYYSTVSNSGGERTPLTPEFLRRDDALYGQMVWRDLDLNEKMNQVFNYNADFDQGSELFANILFNAVVNKKVEAFADERFTSPHTVEEIERNMAGTWDTIAVMKPDDPQGMPKELLVTRTSFDPKTVRRLRIREEWVFDREASRMFVRILAIAPLKTITDPQTGRERGYSPMFWIYYPDLRPVLAQREVYNPKNMGVSRMTWEELFETRMFSSFIVKSTIDNAANRPIRAHIKDPILALLEGDNVKEKIFNYEQDLWSY
jgi:gliding motility associated protien GldN